MGLVKKIVAYGAWLLAFGLSAALAWEFNGDQNKIAIGVALLALILSAFGLLFARDAWRQHAWPEFIFGLLLWCAGAGYFTISELGYWDSSSAEHFAQYEQVKKARQRQEGLMDQKWQALTTGAIPDAPAQLEAQLKSLKLNDRWQATKGCTDATTTPSRAYCQEYFALQGKLAKAHQRVAMEAEFTRISKQEDGKMIHNLLAGAEVISRRLGIDRKLAGDIVVLAAWLFLLMARDLGALVADPVGRREVRTETKENTATTVANIPKEPPAKRSELVPSITLPSFPPEGGTKQKKPDPEPPIEEEDRKLSIAWDRDAPTALWRIDKEPPVKPSRQRSQETSVTRWLRNFEVTELGRGDRGFYARDFYQNYKRFCDSKGESAFHLKRFSRLLRGELDLGKGDKHPTKGQRFDVKLVPALSRVA